MVARYIPIVLLFAVVTADSGTVRTAPNVVEMVVEPDGVATKVQRSEPMPTSFESPVKTDQEASQVQPASLATFEQQAPRTIPDRLLFNFKVNLLENPWAMPGHAANVKKIMDVYNDMQVEFLDNDGCEKKVAMVHSPALAYFFKNEPHGPYKSDLCRLAQLADQGGWYFDNDLEAIADVRKVVPSQTAFVSALTEGDKDDMFNAIIGVAPKHPIIIHALNITFEHYQLKASLEENMKTSESNTKNHVESNDVKISDQDLKDPSLARPMEENVKISQDDLNKVKQASQKSLTENGRMLGPLKIAQSFKWWMGDEKHESLTRPLGAHHHAEHPGVHEDSYLLKESFDNTPYYDSPSRKGGGCCCNFAIVDEFSKQAIFYSRFVGAGELCSQETEEAAKGKEMEKKEPDAKSTTM